MNEEEMQFKSIADQFAVIDSNTVTAIVDEALCSRIRAGYGDWRTLQKKSVSIRYERRNRWCLEEIKPGLFRWTLRYDSFLGYMRGVLDLEMAENEFLIF